MGFDFFCDGTGGIRRRKHGAANTADRRGGFMVVGDPQNSKQVSA
jgi:hypothetical protein